MAFHAVVSQLLADVQERLVYRAHIYVQNDIIGYKPVAGDLAYPEKLEMMEVSVFSAFKPEIIDKRQILASCFRFSIAARVLPRVCRASRYRDH